MENAHSIAQTIQLFQNIHCLGSGIMSGLLFRSIDVLSNDGYGVFAIPDTVVGNPHYQTDRVLVLEKARVLRSEKFNNFAILVLQKNII